MTEEPLDWDSLLDVRWVSLAEAEQSVGVSRSALRTWYRSGQIPSRLVDGPFGPRARGPDRASARTGRELHAHHAEGRP